MVAGQGFTALFLIVLFKGEAWGWDIFIGGVEVDTMRPEQVAGFEVHVHVEFRSVCPSHL